MLIRNKVNQMIILETYLAMAHNRTTKEWEYDTNNRYSYGDYKNHPNTKLHWKIVLIYIELYIKFSLLLLWLMCQSAKKSNILLPSSSSLMSMGQSGIPSPFLVPLIHQPESHLHWEWFSHSRQLPCCWNFGNVQIVLTWPSSTIKSFRKV